MRRILVLTAAICGLVFVASIAPALAGGTDPLSWSSPQTVDSGQALRSIACPTSTLCVTEDGTGGNVITTSDPKAGPWTPTQLDSAGSGALGGVSCSAANFCAVTDGPNVWISTTPTGDAGAWISVPVAASGTLSGISCVAYNSGHFCLAYDAGSGTFYVSSDPTSNSGWTAVSTKTITGSGGSSGPPGPPITGAACAAAGVQLQCLFVDQGDNVVSAQTNSDTATMADPTNWHAVNLGTQDQLLGISCPSLLLCAATNTSGHVRVTTSPLGQASDWQDVPVASSFLNAVSCVVNSGTLCVTTDNQGDMFDSTDPAGGGSWNETAKVDGQHALDAISCSTTLLCSASDGQGNVVTTTGGAAALGISCPSAAATSMSFANDLPSSGSLSGPLGVAMDGTKPLVADTGNNSLDVFNPDGSSVSTFRPQASGSDVLNQPRQAVVVGGELVTTDFSNNRVVKVNAATGAFDGEFDQGGVSWTFPEGIATNADHSLVAVVDLFGNAVYLFDASGTLISKLDASSFSGGRLNHPEGVAFDGAGNVWVADTQNHRVVALDQQNRVLTAWSGNDGGSQQFYPTGLAIDPTTGAVWVADFNSARVAQFDCNGNLLGSPIQSTPSAPLYHPYTLALDAGTGDLYVANSGDNDVARYAVASAGTTTTTTPTTTTTTPTGTTPTTTTPTSTKPTTTTPTTTTPTTTKPSAPPPKPPVNVVRPSVRGSSSPTVGETLHGSAGTWSSAALAFTYKWLRCPKGNASFAAGKCAVAQSGPHPDYKLRKVDAGSLMLLVVTARSSAGLTTSALGKFFSGRVVQASAPENEKRPSVDGSSDPRVGQVFTGHLGSWKGSQPMTFTYRWQRCLAPAHQGGRWRCKTVTTGTIAHDAFDGAAPLPEITYTLLPADVDHRMLLKVKAANFAGSTGPISEPTFSGVIRPAPHVAKNVSAPTVSGPGHPVEGDVFHGHAGTWDQKNLTFLYQWLRCPGSHPDQAYQAGKCTVMDASTKPDYAAQEADIGAEMLLKVTALNDDGLQATAVAKYFTGGVSAKPAPKPAPPPPPSHPDLFLIIRGYASFDPSQPTLGVEDWGGTAADGSNILTVQVVDRAGRFVENANVNVDATGVGDFRTPTFTGFATGPVTEGTGEATVSFYAFWAGTVKLSVSATAADGQTLHGYAQLKVYDRAHTHDGHFETVDGQSFAGTGKNWVCQVGPHDNRTAQGCVTSWLRPLGVSESKPACSQNPFAYGQAAFDQLDTELQSELPSRTASLSNTSRSAINRMRCLVIGGDTRTNQVSPAQVVLAPDTPLAGNPQQVNWDYNVKLWELASGGTPVQVNGNAAPYGQNSLAAAGSGLFQIGGPYGRTDASRYVVNPGSSRVVHFPDGAAVFNDGSSLPPTAGEGDAIAVYSAP